MHRPALASSLISTGWPGRRVKYLENVLILFGRPIEPDVFDSHLGNKFSPILRSVPNVERIEFNQIAGAAHGNSPYYLIVEMQFDSDEAMQEGLNSEAGQAMARDLSEFASGGVTVLFAQVAIDSMAAP